MEEFVKISKKFDFVSKVLSFAVSLFVLSGSASATDLTERELAKFRQNPTAYQTLLPAKYDRYGRQVSDESRFSADSINSREFVSIRDAQRREILMRSAEMRERRNRVHRLAGIRLENDDPKAFVDDGAVIDDLAQAEQAGLRDVQLAESPWSGDYWGIYKGNIGQRYGDPNFPGATDWKENRDYVLAHSVSEIVASNDPLNIDLLSPSEKYELLVGDSLNKLTERMWAEGQAYYENYGEVETWFGICHGWAPAAFMMARPSKVIEVPAQKGDYKIKFYPHDLKALASLLWASAQPEVRFIGGRCNDKDPEKDENGRVLSDDCFDNNPATWHQAVVGQIGTSKRSFVLDATYDYEVWNQPAYSYKYSYFDPENGQSVETLELATRELSTLTNDKYKKYRDPRTKYVVGISMELAYMVETSADRSETNTAEDDRSRRVVYLYDLELDESKKIIGGEWYNNHHPDFMWVPAKGAKAQSLIEYMLTEPWVAGEKVPESWAKPAQYAGAQGQVLGAVVEELIRLSNQP
jgi:hypothetical protein